MLVVNASMPVKSVAELIAYAKQRPGELTYASAGPGSPAHIAAELFLRASGVKMRQVAYRGGGPAVVDVIGGHVNLMFTNLQAVFAGIEFGSLRLLGTGGTKRWPAFPEVPTIAEAGVPGYEASAWYGLLLPAGTPAPIVARLQRALEAVRSADSLKSIRKFGADPVVSTPDLLQRKLEVEIKSYAKLIRETGIGVE